MGAFFVNYQIRCDDQAKVLTAIGELAQGRAYISPPKYGWVTVYDEISENQDAYEIGRLGSELSTKLETVVFAFLVNDSTMFVYYLFDNGDLLDEYNSNPPPNHEHAEADQQVRFAGRPDILMNYCVPGTNRSDIEAALLRAESLVEGGFATSVHAEERLQALATALLMDELRASLGFIDFDHRRTRIPEGRDFQLIDGRKLRRPSMRRIPPQIPHPPRA
jgi:hypothetical protein